MLLTFISTWLFGLLCMSLDQMRLYSKANKIMNHILDMYLLEISDTLDHMTSYERSEFLDFVHHMNSDRPGYLFYFLVSCAVMAVIWPASLLQLTLSQKKYELSCILYMVSDIRVVIQKIHQVLCIKNILNNNDIPLNTDLEVDIEKLLSSLD
jgi:hypothetical protein